MAEKEKKKDEEKPAAAPAAGHGEGEKKPKAGGGLFKSLPVMLGGVMILEAVVLFAGFKFLGGGAHHAQGADLAASEGKPEGSGEKGDGGKTDAGDKKTVEVEVLRDKFLNRQNGRLMLYDLRIVAVVNGEHSDAVTEKLKSHDALVHDRVRTLIAQSDPEKLGGGVEPGLETLRRQVKYQLDEIVGEGMIDEVLVPSCTPFQSGL